MRALPQLERVKAFSSALAVRRWTYDATKKYAATAAAHPTIEVSFIDRGAIALSIGSRTHEVAAGTAMLVPAGVEHLTTFLGPMVGGSVHLAASMFEEIEQRASALRAALAPGVLPSDRAFRIAQLLAEEAVHQDPAAMLATDALAEALVITLMREAPAERGPRGHDPRIRRAVELVRTSGQGPLSIAEMARAAGMSRFHFSRAFRAATGKSPYQYVIDVRLELAAAMLGRGHTSVSEAAFASGFSDLPRFARAFKRKYGVVPSAHAR